MSGDSPPEDDKREDADAEFQRVLGNLVNTPHKPHVKKSETDSERTEEKRAAPKSGPKLGD